MNEGKAVLRAARAELTDHEWVQGSYATGDKGRPCPAGVPLVRGLCLSGAIWRAWYRGQFTDNDLRGAYLLVLRVINPQWPGGRSGQTPVLPVTLFNDKQGQTKEHVLFVLDQAIGGTRGSG